MKVIQFRLFTPLWISASAGLILLRSTDWVTQKKSSQRPCGGADRAPMSSPSANACGMQVEPWEPASRPRRFGRSAKTVFADYKRMSSIYTRSTGQSPDHDL